MLKWENTTKYERRSIITLLLAFIALFISNLPIFTENNLDGIYLTLHIFFEVIAITISFAIAMQSWVVFSYRPTFAQLIIFSSFLAVGTFDFFYTVTFYGMPLSYLDYSINLSIWFWVVARIIQATMILWFVVLQDRILDKQIKYPFFMATVTFIAVICLSIFHFNNHLPVLFREGSGSTIWHKMIEPLILMIITITIVKLWKFYKKGRIPATLALIMATIFFLFSELVFFFNITVYDLSNLLGRFFKIASFFFYMRGIYIGTIQAPYEHNEQVRKYLYQRERLLQAINDSLGEGLMVLDKEQQLIMINPEGERILGYKQNEIKNENIHRLIHNRKADGSPYHIHECPIYQTLETKKKRHVEEDVFINREGKAIPVSYTATPLIENGEITGSVVTFKDISEQKKINDRIRFLAYYDSLTKLPNRYYFMQKLQEEIKKTKKGETMGVIFMDVDNLQNINDHFGHEIGDQVIVECSKKLTSSKLPIFVAYLGSDEFGIILKDREDNIENTARYLLESVKDPFLINGKNIFVSVSMGISVFPKDSRSHAELLQFAHIAMFSAKKKGKGHIQFYNLDLDKRRLRNAWIEENLYEALVSNQFSVHYQSIVNTSTRQIVGIEALARWKHPEKGYIPPNQFIPVAENNGLIIPIGIYVLETSCRDLAKLQQQGLTDLYLNVNVSIQQLKYPNFLQIVKDIIHKYGLAPEHIVFEITETITLLEDTDLIEILQEFKNSGFRIAIDDFGKGYSSIGYLRQITVDTIKIDKSYVWDVHRNQIVARLTNAIIAMANSLNIEVVVEGVEDWEHLNFIKHHPHIQAQGYLFNKPVPFNEFLRLLQKTS